jgi:hypothetical protein
MREVYRVGSFGLRELYYSQPFVPGNDHAAELTSTATQMRNEQDGGCGDADCDAFFTGMLEAKVY